MLTLKFLSYQDILPRVVHKSNPTHILLVRNTCKEEKVNADGGQELQNVPIPATTLLFSLICLIWPLHHIKQQRQHSFSRHLSLTGNFGPCWAQQRLSNTQPPEQRPSEQKGSFTESFPEQGELSRFKVWPTWNNQTQDNV